MNQKTAAGRIKPGLADTGLPPMAVFRDIPVVPTDFAYRTVYNGGPVWPDQDTPVEPRHCRHGKPMPIDPPPVASKLPYADESFAWGGQVHRAFGHQVAEYSTRVPQSLRDRPDDRLLFTLWPGGSVRNIPAHFWAVLDWYGVPRERIAFVTSPFRAREVWVAAQPEQLGGPGPGQEFLDLLAENLHRRTLDPGENETVYVSRAGLLKQHKSCWLGEGYLTGLLEKNGVLVFSPEQEPLRTQLAHYAGAKTLVFAEGSAAHGRQLLGYHAQKIAVLVRRPGMRIAHQVLDCRCDALVYENVTRSNISLVLAGGKPDSDRALSVYDPERLLAAWKDAGVDLSRDWDDADFRNACERDLRAWAEATFDPVRQREQSFDWETSIDQVRQDIVNAGFADLIPALEPFLTRNVAPAPLGQRILGRTRRMRQGVAKVLRPRT